MSRARALILLLTACGLAAALASVLIRQEAVARAEDEARFLVALRGPAEPYLVDEVGRATGIEPVSGRREARIPGARIEGAAGERRLVLEAAGPGGYALHVRAAPGRLFSLRLEYGAGPDRVAREYFGIGQEQPVSLSVRLAPGRREKLAVRFALPPPDGLTLEHAGAQGRLVWEPDPAPGVVAYNVYARAGEEPFVQLLGTTRTSAYPLTGPAAGASYAVSALDAAGRESVLSAAVADVGGSGGDEARSLGLGPGSGPASTRTSGAAATHGDRVASAATEVRPGGLVAYPESKLGPDLEANGGFEEGGATASGWSGSGFVRDTSVARTGGASLRLSDANLIPYAQAASQALSLHKGAYRISAWVRLQDMAANRGNGVRLRLDGDSGGGATEIVKGTSDWQYLEGRNLVLTQDETARLRLEAHGEPDGTAWFDDVRISEELPLPLDVFMLYPNFRGMLFDDQSQTLRFDVAVTPPAGSRLGDLTVEGAIVDEERGSLVVRGRFAATDRVNARIPALGLVSGRSYGARFRLLRGETVLYEHPGYRVTRVPAGVRASMRFAFDEQGRILVRGRPTFLLGVYDSGLGYPSGEAAWEQMLTKSRRLFELPLNVYLNYWYGGAPVGAMSTMMTVLQRHGILYLQTANCFNDKFDPDRFPTHADDDYLRGLAAHPGLGGFYTADECVPELAPLVFERSQRLAAFDPDGLNFAALRPRPNVRYWRDVVDLLATDPYPLFGAEPAGGYPLHEVGEGARLTREAVQASRPFATVLQFFHGTAQSRWPTQSELRSMSYMAIAEGANGLFYWSLGANALAYVCDGWCDRKTDYFERLRSVLNELKGLEDALSGTDDPSLLSENSDPGAIRTRVKVSGARAWLIAVNESRGGVSATFRWAVSPGEVSVYAEDRRLAASGSRFTDSFAPYQAHVYALSAR